MLRCRQNARRRGKLRSGHSSAHRARCHPHPRIIANPFRLPHVASRHHVELAAFFSKPYRSGDARSGFAKRCQGNILLTLNGSGNRTWHSFYFRSSTPQYVAPPSRRLSRGRLAPECEGKMPALPQSNTRRHYSGPPLSSLVRNLPAPIAPVPSYVLQA